MYETGGVQFFEVLAQSSSIGDFLNNAEYVAQLSEYDRAELIKYQETVQEIEDKEAALELEYQELDALRNELIDKQAEVEAELADNEEELAEVQKTLWPKYKDNKNFALLVIGREHTDADLSKYNEKKGFTFPLYPDKNRSIYGAFAKNLIPRSYLVDKSGKVIYTSKGYNDEDFASLMKAIETALK